MFLAEAYHPETFHWHSWPRLAYLTRIWKRKKKQFQKQNHKFEFWLLTTVATGPDLMENQIQAYPRSTSTVREPSWYAVRLWWLFPFTLLLRILWIYSLKQFQVLHWRVYQWLYSPRHWISMNKTWYYSSYNMASWSQSSLNDLSLGDLPH